MFSLYLTDYRNYFSSVFVVMRFFSVSRLVCLLNLCVCFELYRFNLRKRAQVCLKMRRFAMRCVDELAEIVDVNHMSRG